MSSDSLPQASGAPSALSPVSAPASPLSPFASAPASASSSPASASASLSSSSSASSALASASSPSVKNKKNKNPNWQIEEDKQLCCSWLNTSKDPRIGLLDAQRVEKGFKPFPERLRSALECRWSTVQQRINKFCGFFSQIEKTLGSGRNLEDHVAEAKELFQATIGLPFTLDHCWVLLRHAPKWQQTNEEAKAKEERRKKPKSAKRKQQDKDAAASTIVLDDTEGQNDDEVVELSERPVGRNRAKAASAAKQSLVAAAEEVARRQKELIDISRQKLEAMRTVADDAIMGRDLSAAFRRDMASRK